MAITPLNDKVVIRVGKKKEETTNSGLVLPEGVNQATPNQGEVIAVGPGRVIDASFTPATLDDKGTSSGAVLSRLNPTVKVGDKVAFNPFAPTIITVEGEDLYIVKEDDILAVIS